MARSKPAAAEDFSDVMDALPLSRRVLVNVKRDQTTSTPRIVWQHEVPILEAIFGEGNVVDADPKILDEGYSAKASPDLLVHNKIQDPIKRPSDVVGIGHVFIGHPQTEYDRLAAVYGRHPEVNQSFVENVYERFSRGLFQIALGEPELKDLPESQLRALVQSYGYAMPIISAKESTDADKKAAADARAKFNAMTHADLVKLADELGVEIGG